MRLALAGLHRRRALAQAIQARGAECPGALRCSADHRTGNVLLILRSDAELATAVEWLQTVAQAFFRDRGTEPPAPPPARASTVGSAAVVSGARELAGTVRRRTAGIVESLQLTLRPTKSPDGVTPSRGAANPARATPTPSTPWHCLDADSAVRFWETHAQRGLGAEESSIRLRRHGANVLEVARARPAFEIFLDQLKSVPVAMLGASAVLSLATGGVGDAVMIGVVVAINATVGFLTEHGAERAVAALNRTEQRDVPVMRDGNVVRIPVEDVVVGDILLLTPGVSVPADARLTGADRLTVDESALTGESAPVSKRESALGDEKLPLAERGNMVYRGTVITGGSGAAVVVATGSRTEIGAIQALLNDVRPPATAMQKQLASLGRYTAVVAGGACAGVLVFGALRGQPLLPLLQTAVSLAVAAVPEGLPTVAITTLALGLTRMREHNALVRRLDAVETLGALQVVCLDKTGTLTENRMSVVALHVDLERLSVDGGRFVSERGPVEPGDSPALRWLFEVAVLCNEVELEEVNGALVLHGSPTEAALVQAALDGGIDVAGLRRRNPTLRTRHRSEDRNIMSTLHEKDSATARLLAVKGRPAEVLGRCRHIHAGGEVRALGAEDREAIERENERMAGRALRVLGVAYLDERSQAALVERELVWLGLVGLADPPRPGMAALMESFHGAGVRTVMVTGDQSTTAFAVAREVGLKRGERTEILDSTQLDAVDPELLSSLASHVDVFSRVSPAHKLQIVQAMQGAGQVVAMTGDGINDGPALRAADLGIAMGAGGTSVARDVADIVLEDDNLETMIEAVRQGRAIYDDIRKAVHFILATNASEILVTLAMVAGGFRHTLTPMQLLWINLATDIFPELALAVQPPESDVLARPPRDPTAPMFSAEDYRRITLEGSFISAAAVGSFLWGLRRYGQGPQAATMAFLTLVGAQLAHVFSVKSEHHTLLDGERGPGNRYLPLSLLGGASMTLLAQLVPGMRRLLGSAPIASSDWLAVGLGSVGPLLASELTKRRALPRKELSKGAI
jgi:Ca2+-transporting ATPase